MDELTQRVHDLPPELFSKIYDFTFTPAPAIHIIDKQYKPPAILTVDRASRRLYASRYYNRAYSIFYFNKGSDLEWWCLSLSEEHFRFSGEVKTQILGGWSYNFGDKPALMRQDLATRAWDSIAAAFLKGRRSSLGTEID